MSAWKVKTKQLKGSWSSLSRRDWEDTQTCFPGFLLDWSSTSSPVHLSGSLLSNRSSYDIIPFVGSSSSVTQPTGGPPPGQEPPPPWALPYRGTGRAQPLQAQASTDRTSTPAPRGQEAKNQLSSQIQTRRVWLWPVNSYGWSYWLTVCPERGYLAGPAHTSSSSPAPTCPHPQGSWWRSLASPLG